MKELLEEYKETLQLTWRELIDVEKNPSNYQDADSYYWILKKAESDLLYVIEWLEMGFQPNALYRGAQRNDAYYVMRPYDPFVIERYIENKQVHEPFQELEAEEERYLDELIDWETQQLYEQAKSRLKRDERELLLLLMQGETQKQIAAYAGVTQQAVSKRIRSVKKKLMKIGIERVDL